MEFTINDLKIRGPLGHKQFKKIYDWDCVKYHRLAQGGVIGVYRNNVPVREFTPEEFAYLVVMTGCTDNWYEFHDNIKSNIFSAEEVAYMIDIMQEYKRTLSNEKAEDFEETIKFCRAQLRKHGFEYYWPAKGSKFDSNLHYAIGIVDDSVCNSGEIARVQNGGIKNIITGKFYKFPKVYIAR